jgi:hypothetical protein
MLGYSINYSDVNRNLNCMGSSPRNMLKPEKRGANRMTTTVDPAVRQADTVPQLTDIADYLENEGTLAKVLTGWSVGSIGLGLLMQQSHDEMQKGIGDQFVGWGAIDLLLALNGWRTNRKHRKLVAEGKLTAAEVEGKRTTLRRILMFNAGLDVLYVLGGLNLSGNERPRWQGWGFGIVVQGLFLFIFDLFWAKKFK